MQVICDNRDEIYFNRILSRRALFKGHFTPGLVTC